MGDPIVIVGMARTPLGAFGGSLSSCQAPELAAVAIAAAVARAGVEPAMVDEVLMGCVLPAGSKQAPARQAALAADLPISAAATTVNKVCGSGMKAVMMAADALQLDHAAVAVAGGMESMSNAPYLLPKARRGYRMGHGEVIDHMFLDGLQDAYSGGSMGSFAELCAEKYGFSRQQQDHYAVESLRRANLAVAENLFAEEIAAVKIAVHGGEKVVSCDEQPLKGDPEKIPTMRPVFKKYGTITAANASSISDGAAALVLMKRSRAIALGLKPLAAIRGYAQHAQQPQWFSTAPAPAIEKVMQPLGWTVDGVDLFEVNEAFAVVAMAAMRQLGIPHQKINVNGGATALGHPLGASGARIIVTLLAALRQRGQSRGIASLCIGGGEATAIAIELL